MSRVLKSLAAVLMLVLTLAAAAPVALDVYHRPVRSVRIAGEFEHLTREALRTAIRESLQAGFYGINVSEVRQTARRLPWVRDVTVQRIWPDSLNITLMERNAVARWNSDALLENDASLFRPVEGIADYNYTQLQGPPGMQAYMLEQYKRLATALGTLGGGIRGLSLSRQEQWQIEFGNGMTLAPGTRLDVEALKEFARVAPQVIGVDLARVKSIDLRYANGFAVRWRKSHGPRPEGSKG